MHHTLPPSECLSEHTVRRRFGKLSKLFGNTPVKQPNIPEQPRHNARPRALLDEFGKFQGRHEEIIDTFADPAFDPLRFVNKHMAHLQERGFETAFGELTELSTFVESGVRSPNPPLTYFDIALTALRRRFPSAESRAH